MSRTLILVLVLAGCEPTTHIQVEGTVKALADGSPVSEARVVVGLMSFLDAGEQIVSVTTNSQGYYALSWLEEGYCPQSLLTIGAHKAGYISSVRYNIIRCTEDLQTIHFRLESDTAFSPPMEVERTER